MTKEEVLEKLKEERESAKSKILYGQSRNLSVKRYGWYFNGVDYAIDLAEKLDEPKKVVIPQFVADWIEEYSGCCSRLEIVNQIILNKTFENDWWLNSGDNQELLLKAITNGYEVENKIEKYVRLKGFEGTMNYLNYDVNSKEFFVDTMGLGSGIKIKFTPSWLKDNFPEYDDYNNAGLLEFEEVEDD